MSDPDGTRSEVVSGVCPNCGGAGVGRFCPSCGQEEAFRVPSLREWLGEVREEYWVLDGKVLRTVACLIRRPGRLTSDWIDGRRARYVRPFRLFVLTLPILLLAAFNSRAQWILVIPSVLFLAGASYLVIDLPRRRGSVVPHVVLSLHIHAVLLLAFLLASALLWLEYRFSAPTGVLAVLLLGVVYGGHLSATVRRCFAEDWVTASLKAGLIGIAHLLMMVALLAAVFASYGFFTDVA